MTASHLCIAAYAVSGALMWGYVGWLVVRLGKRREL
jgi:hypothetical protein